MNFSNTDDVQENDYYHKVQVSRNTKIHEGMLC